MEIVKINKSWCKGCGVCVAFCPKGALQLEHEKAVHDPEKCVVCGMCEQLCPDLALEVDMSQKKKKKGA